MFEGSNVLEDVPIGVKERSGLWGPNRVFNGTQDEFMEHIREIEAGEFISLEEHKIRADAWLKEFLKSRSK